MPVVSLVNSQEGVMTRLHVLAAFSVILAACSLDVAPLNNPKIVVTPVLDSLFVGDQLVKRQVTFVDSHGNVQDPGVVIWTTSDTSVLAVDSLTGRITGRKAGVAVLYADAQNAEGFAVIVVSPPLKVTLLVDTIFLMPGDTFSAPVEVVHQAPGTPMVWFSAVASAAVTVDSATGLVTANAVGGPVSITAHAALSPDTVTDGGTIQVLQLSDTTGGAAYYTIFGTVQRARRVTVRGAIYPRNGGTPTFQLVLQTLNGATVLEEADIVLRTPPAGPGAYPIDSLSLLEAPRQGVDPVCNPPRDWGRWFTFVQAARLDAVSRNGGTLSIAQIVSVPHGQVISGHFYLPVQRTDRFVDPTALLPIRGTFVAPVITGPSTCH
jgi:hypothetical protein